MNGLPGVVLQSLLGPTVKLVGVMFAIISGVASAAYIYGRHSQRTESRADTVESNQNQLEALSDGIQHLETAAESLSGTMAEMQTQMRKNREDIRYQHRLMHDQLLGEDEDCGNPKCPHCHPENFARDTTIEDPIPESVRERFGSWDGSED
jgi:TolA-binding protein